MLDIISYLLGYKKGKGSGGDVTVVSFTATENGTYNAPSGEAYSPVMVQIPVYDGSVENA